MNIFLNIIAMLMALSSVTANAELVELTFGGTLTDVDSRLSSAYSVGNTYSVDLTYDTSGSVLGPYQSPEQAMFEQVQMNAHVIMNGNQFFDTSNIGIAYVTHGSPCCDSFALYGESPQGPSAGAFLPSQFFVGLWSSVGTIFSSTGLPPSTTDGSLFNNSKQFDFNFFGPGGYAQIQGTVENVQFQAAPVPEPETYAMMLAGLGLLGFVARRRQQKTS